MNVTQIFEEALLAYIRCNQDSEARYVIEWHVSEPGEAEIIDVTYIRGKHPVEPCLFRWRGTLHELMEAVDDHVDADLINRY